MIQNVPKLSQRFPNDLKGLNMLQSVPNSPRAKWVTYYALQCNAVHPCSCKKLKTKKWKILIHLSLLWVSDNSLTFPKKYFAGFLVNIFWHWIKRMINVDIRRSLLKPWSWAPWSPWGGSGRSCAGGTWSRSKSSSRSRSISIIRSRSSTSQWPSAWPSYAPGQGAWL